MRTVRPERIGAFLALLAADQPITQDILLGDEFQIVVGEPGFERQHQRHRAAFCCQPQRFLPVFGQRRLYLRPGLAKNRRDAGAAAG